MIIIADPEMTKQFLHSQHNYEKVKMPFLQYFPKGLFSANGDLWKRQKKHLVNSFHFQALKNRIPVILKLAEQALEKAPIGKPFQVVKFCQLVTSEVIVQSFFSDDFSN